jgi:uncharacterized phage-associated protein
MSYDELKTAQAAAFLLRRAGGRMPFIKLLKLLYLGERVSFQRYGYALTGDNLVSMDNGPVLSKTYDHIKGGRMSKAGGWDTWVADEANYMVALTDHAEHVPDEELLELSDSDVDVLDRVWREYGHMDKWALVDLTHTLPEWENPNGSSLPIDWQKLLTAVGYSEGAAQRLVEQLLNQRALDRQFA